MNQALTVTRSNELVQANYYLTLNERRLIESAIAKVKNGEALPLILKITASEFSEAWGVDLPHAYSELKKIAISLKKKTLKLRHPENDENWVISWVDAIGYQDRLGYIKLSFSQHIKPYLEQLKHNYTNYALIEVSGLKSANSMRLYELLMQFKKTGYRVDAIDTLKEHFGVSNKYTRWIDFYKKVLKPAIDDINLNTEYQIEINTIKEGRAIAKVEFSFSLKSQLELNV